MRCGHWDVSPRTQGHGNGSNGERGSTFIRLSHWSWVRKSEGTSSMESRTAITRAHRGLTEGRESAGGRENQLSWGSGHGDQGCFPGGMSREKTQDSLQGDGQHGDLASLGHCWLQGVLRLQ